MSTYKIRVKKFQYSGKIPAYKSRSESEVEQILHKAKAVARKRQIQLALLDSEIEDINPLSMSQFTTHKRRIDLLKTIWSQLRSLMP